MVVPFGRWWTPPKLMVVRKPTFKKLWLDFQGYNIFQMGWNYQPENCIDTESIPPFPFSSLFSLHLAPSFFLLWGPGAPYCEAVGASAVFFEPRGGSLGWVFLCPKKKIWKIVPKYIKCDRYFWLKIIWFHLDVGWVSFKEFGFSKLWGGIFWQNAGSVAVA